MGNEQNQWGAETEKQKLIETEGKERKERRLHYGRASSPLESVYLFSRQEESNAQHNEMDSSEVHSANEPTCPESSSF